MLSPPWAAHLPTGAVAADVDLLARGSLPAAWAENWRSERGRPVLRDVDGTWLTAGELLLRTEQVAGRFAAAGLRTGDRVVVSGDASAALVVAHVAALRAGLVVVPVNSAYTRRELDVCLLDARPRAALLERADMREWARRTDPGMVVTGTTVDLPDGPPPELDAVAASFPALLAYTSGTTGTPKGAVLSHGNLLASAEAVRLAWRWSPDDRLVLCLPLFHIHGLGVGVHGTFLAGASATLHRGFDPEEVLATAARRDGAGRATLFFGVPTMYARLAAADGVERLNALRLCVSGSAPLSAELHERIRSCSGQVVLERYGMTETVMLVSNPYEGERRPGTVGIPLPGVEVRLDAEGEVLVRGPSVFSGYLGRDDANEAAFTADGFFRTGDVGDHDDAGYLRIVGRAKELIITGGYNVYPREVEDVLRAHPAVADAAVVGTPSPEWGEVVTAFLESDDAHLDTDEVLAWAAARLAPYKRPRVVHRVDALPRNRLGKVVRDQLR